jgi:hypothetical protein
MKWKVLGLRQMGRNLAVGRRTRPGLPCRWRALERTPWVSPDATGLVPWIWARAKHAKVEGVPREIVEEVLAKLVAILE